MRTQSKLLFQPCHDELKPLSKRIGEMFGKEQLRDMLNPLCYGKRMHYCAIITLVMRIKYHSILFPLCFEYEEKNPLTFKML